MSLWSKWTVIDTENKNRLDEKEILQLLKILNIRLPLKYIQGKFQVRLF